MMKTRSTAHPRTILALCIALLATPTAFAASRSAAAPAAAETATLPRLQLRVEIPTTLEQMRPEEVADVLAKELQNTFHRAGFVGGIILLDSTDEMLPGLPLIALRVVDWGEGQGGFVTCRLSANLTRPDGSSAALGTVNGTVILTGHYSRPDLNHAYLEAAEKATRALWQRFRKRASTPAPAAGRD